MGLFSKTKKAPLQLTAPMKGQIIDITEVPDAVFSNKYVGDGVAIYPTEGKVYSPVNGEIMLMAETGHAIGIKTKEGFEILIHVGLDTVNMHGKGFENLITEGDQVKKGQLLMNFDLELVKAQAKSTVSPIVISNMEVVEQIEKNGLAGDKNVLMTVFEKL
jgi:glucose-specific phosphotransferase system IIA component